MSGTYTVRVGDKGRTVVPADFRERHGWAEGTTLVAVEAGDGSGALLLLSRDDALAQVREQLAGRDLVRELLEERRAAADLDDAVA